MGSPLITTELNYEIGMFLTGGILRTIEKNRLKVYR